MSSQVNKSNVRFKPKVKQRTRQNSNARRSSVTINTTFSTPGDRDALKARASVNESAIDDDEDFKLPPARDLSMPPPKQKDEVKEKEAEVAKVDVQHVKVGLEAQVEAKTQASQTGTQVETQVDTPQNSKPAGPLPQPAAVSVTSNVPPAVVPPAVAPPAVAPIHEHEEPGSAPPSPKTVPQIIKAAIPQPVQPLLQLVPVKEQEPQAPQQQQQQLQVQPQEQALDLIEDEEDVDDDEGDEYREPVYDQSGREIIEPRDLKRMGKFNAKTHYHNRVINADTFTMATLCGDVPIGELNEEYYEYEEVRTSRKRNRALLLQAKRMIRGQYQPTTKAKEMQLLRVYKDWQDEREIKYGTKRPGVDIDSLEGPAAVAQQQPQLAVDASGKIIVEQTSLLVDRHANNKADDESENGQQRIEARKFGDHINSYSFSTKERPERWSSLETETFYNAVSVWGTDFNLIAQFFPQRTRGQIKTKFKYEERRNPDKLRLFLVHRKKVKLEDVARISGTTIVPAADIEADLAQVRKEHEEQMRKETEAKAAAAKEDAQRKSMDHMRKRQARGISGSSEVVGELSNAKKEEEEDW